MSMATLLDGGMGHMLRRLGVKIEGEIGSQQRFLGVALANIEKPDLVRQAHQAYIDAGADIITTNSYSIVPATLDLPGSQYSAKDLEHLLVESAKRAKEAVESRPGCNVRIAGCLPPLKASYKAEQVGKIEEMLPIYERIASSLLPYVDMFLAETLTKSDEAVATAQAVVNVQREVPVENRKTLCVAVTLEDDPLPAVPALRGGENLDEFVSKLLTVSGVDGSIFHESILCGVLCNCCSPDSVSSALPLLREVLHQHGVGVAIGGYANGFSTVHSHESTGDCHDSAHSEYDPRGTPEYYTELVEGWMSAEGGGANMVGGCCGIFPEHIKAVKEMIKNRVH